MERCEQIAMDFVQEKSFFEHKANCLDYNGSVIKEGDYVTTQRGVQADFYTEGFVKAILYDMSGMAWIQIATIGGKIIKYADSPNRYIVTNGVV